MVTSTSVKTPTLLLTLLLGAGVLTACGGGQDEAPNTDSANVSIAELAPFDVNQEQDLLDATSLTPAGQLTSSATSATTPTLEQCAKLPAIGTVQTAALPSRRPEPVSKAIATRPANSETRASG